MKFGHQKFIELMKTTKPNLTAFLAFMMLALAGIPSQAQLPADYTTKVSYHERKEVSYEIPGEATLKCLTLSELSRYHDYMQFYKMDEYVDRKGDLYTDQQFIEEQNVRDDWMEGYGRIVCGSKTIDIYDTDGALIHQTDRVVDPDEKFATPAESKNYGFLNFNANYYSQLMDTLKENGLQVSQLNGQIVATGHNIKYTFDQSSRTAALTEYENDGNKSAETVTSYQLNHTGDTYFPHTEVRMEWFMTENGCCIRKITKITKYYYNREVAQGNQPMIGNPADGNPSQQDDRVEILAQADGRSFRIHPSKSTQAEFRAIVYDMAGKIILEQTIQAEKRISIPTSARSGMYLIHVYAPNNPKPTVSKLILPGSGNEIQSK